MTIAEKLTTIAENQQKVYDAGYEKGKAEGGGVVIDPDKIIEATETGSFISIHDVSEIPHKCTVSVDKDTRVWIILSNNLWDEQVQSGHYSTASGELEANKYVISSANAIPVHFMSKVYHTAPCTLTLFFYDISGNLLSTKTAAANTPYDVPASAVSMRFNIASSYGTTYNNDICVAMSLATYEPYNGTAYDIAAGETVIVDAIHPKMTMYSDNGAVITFGYHKSWGMQAEYDRWWDLFQMNGTRTSYPYAFYNWREGMLTPKYPIRMVDSNAAQNTFAQLRCTEIPVDIEIGNNNPQYWSNNAGNTFSGANMLVTIKKLIISSDSVQFPSTFNNCTALQNITFEGSIANSINFSWSPLTNASVQSIIDHLKDLTGQTTQTLTLKADVGAAVTDAQKAAITAKNWTLAY